MKNNIVTEYWMLQDRKNKNVFAINDSGDFSMFVLPIKYKPEKDTYHKRWKLVRVRIEVLEGENGKE